MSITSEGAKMDIVNSVPSIEELHKYSQSVLYFLSKIKVNNSNPEFKAHLKSVYELLGQLKQYEDFLAQHKALLKEAKSKHEKQKA